MDYKFITIITALFLLMIMLICIHKDIIDSINEPDIKTAISCRFVLDGIDFD